MVHPSQQLSVDGQSAVKLVPGGGHQPHGELSLEHQHGTPREKKRQNRFEMWGNIQFKNSASVVCQTGRKADAAEA